MVPPAFRCARLPLPCSVLNQPAGPCHHDICSGDWSVHWSGPRAVFSIGLCTWPLLMASWCLADSDAAGGASRNNIVPLLPGAPRCSFYSSCASSVLRSLPV